MNLAQTIDPLRPGCISWERATAAENLPPRHRQSLTQEVRTHVAAVRPDGRTLRPSVKSRGLRRGARNVVELVRRLGSATLGAIVAGARAMEPQPPSRRTVTVRVTNLHKRGYLRRWGERRHYRYTATGKT